MAKISLVRLDSRLIHGQVITKWVKIAKANRIIIIDDELSKDDFMVMIYAPHQKMCLLRLYQLIRQQRNGKKMNLERER